MQQLADLLLFTKANTFGAIAIRGAIWIMIVLLFAFGLDKGKKIKHIKADIGWVFFILITLAIVSLIFFGIIPTF